MILIIGTSSVGKTTVGEILRQQFDQHYLFLGLDTYFKMVDPKWSGAYGGSLSVAGFRYVRKQGKFPTRMIKYGSVGRTVIRGMHESIAALLKAGNNLIVDEMLLDEWVLSDWVDALKELKVYVINLVANLDVLKQREIARGNELGLVRGHYEFNRIKYSDLKIDTSRLPIEEVSSKIFERVSSDRKPFVLILYSRDVNMD